MLASRPPPAHLTFVRLPVRAVMHLENRPGIVSMLAGKPNTSTFPITSLNFTLRDPTNLETEIPIQLTEDELALGLQYTPTIGIPKLVEWAYGLQKASHGREKGEGWSLAIGNGAQDLIYKVINFVNVVGVSWG